MANPATGINHKMYYVAESAIGTTPTTPAFKYLPHTSTGLNLTKDAIESEELGGRSRKCVKHGNRQVAGPVDYELNFGDFDELLEAALCGDWAVDEPAAGTDQLKTGKERRGFTVLREYGELGANRYEYFSGCEVNEFTLSVNPNANITGGFALVGVDSPASNSEIAGSTYAEKIGGCPFNGFVGAITEGGSPLAVVTSLELTLANGIEPSFVLFSKVSAQKSIGRIQCNGTLTAQLTDMALVNKFKNETSSDLSFTLEDDAGNELKVIMPNVKFNSADKPTNGDGEMTVSLEFSVLYDDTADAELVIEATAA